MVGLMRSILSGFLGAVALTCVHQFGRRSLRNPPRMDTLGRRAIVRGMKTLGLEPPRGKGLQWLTLGGDVVSNTLYYSLIGLAGRSSLLGGALLGSLAGLGAIVLPPWLGLGRRPRGISARKQALTFGWYLIGGLASALTYRSLQKSPLQPQMVQPPIHRDREAVRELAGTAAS